jgi:hypothetical protein
MDVVSLPSMPSQMFFLNRRRDPRNDLIYGFTNGTITTKLSSGSRDTYSATHGMNWLDNHSDTLVLASTGSNTLVFVHMHDASNIDAVHASGGTGRVLDLPTRCPLRISKSHAKNSSSNFSSYYYVGATCLVLAVIFVAAAATRCIFRWWQTPSLPKYTGGLAMDEATLKTVQWNEQEGDFVTIEEDDEEVIEFQEAIEFQEDMLKAVFA